jgi:hypothetical protein
MQGKLGFYFFFIHSTKTLPILKIPTSVLEQKKEIVLLRKKKFKACA